MRRNLDLIRHILITVEDSSKSRIYIEDFLTPEYDASTISYHISLLLDCDYIEVTNIPMCGCSYEHFIVNRLTSQGHDYLDNIRDDTVWNETKKQVSKVSSSVSLEIIKSVSGKIILGLLGL